jgi:hypothetical protein
MTSLLLDPEEEAKLFDFVSSKALSGVVVDDFPE